MLTTSSSAPATPSPIDPRSQLDEILLTTRRLTGLLRSFSQALSESRERFLESTTTTDLSKFSMLRFPIPCEGSFLGGLGGFVDNMGLLTVRDGERSPLEHLREVLTEVVPYCKNAECEHGFLRHGLDCLFRWNRFCMQTRHTNETLHEDLLNSLAQGERISRELCRKEIGPEVLVSVSKWVRLERKMNERLERFDQGISSARELAAELGDSTTPAQEIQKWIQRAEAQRHALSEKTDTLQEYCSFVKTLVEIVPEKFLVGEEESYESPCPVGEEEVMRPRRKPQQQEARLDLKIELIQIELSRTRETIDSLNEWHLDEWIGKLGNATLVRLDSESEGETETAVIGNPFSEFFFRLRQKMTGRASRFYETQETLKCDRLKLKLKDLNERKQTIVFRVGALKVQEAFLKKERLDFRGILTEFMTARDRSNDEDFLSELHTTVEEMSSRHQRLQTEIDALAVELQELSREVSTPKREDEEEELLQLKETVKLALVTPLRAFRITRESVFEFNQTVKCLKKGSETPNLMDYLRVNVSRLHVFDLSEWDSLKTRREALTDEVSGIPHLSRAQTALAELKEIVTVVERQETMAAELIRDALSSIQQIDQVRNLISVEWPEDLRRLILTKLVQRERQLVVDLAMLRSSRQLVFPGCIFSVPVRRRKKPVLEYVGDCRFTFESNDDHLDLPDGSPRTDPLRLCKDGIGLLVRPSWARHYDFLGTFVDGVLDCASIDSPVIKYDHRSGHEWGRVLFVQGRQVTEKTFAEARASADS